MLSRVSGSTGNGYFSQAVAEYARKMKPEKEQNGHSSGKAIGEFSEKEWNGMLHKVDLSIEEHKSGQIYEANVLWEGKVRSMRFHKIEAEMAQWKEQDEDVLSYALFPQVATEFFKYRQAQKTKIDPSVADTKTGAYPV